MIRVGLLVLELFFFESFVMNIVNFIWIEVNKVLYIVCIVVFGKDFKLFLLVSVWYVSSELGF